MEKVAARSITAADTGRAYWERHAKRYDKSTRFLSRPVPRMLELCVDAARDKGAMLEGAAGTGLITTAIAGVVGELIATDYAAEMAGQTSHAVASALGHSTPAVTHAHYIEAGAKRRASTRRVTGKLGDAAARMRIVGNG